MINIVVGKPGTGKTYTLVKLADKWLAQGIDVYSNFYIDELALIKRREKKIWYRIKKILCRVLGKNLKPSKRGRLYFWDSLKDLISIRGGKILIDECQIYFNSRGWKDLPPALQYKFQQHRKHVKRDDNGKIVMSLDIYGAVQNVKRIDTVVRELVNNVLQLHKFGPFFYWNEFDVEEIDKPTKRKSHDFKMYFFSKSLAQCYDTYQEISGFNLFAKSVIQGDEQLKGIDDLKVDEVETAISVKIPNVVRIRPIKISQFGNLSIIGHRERG